MYTLAWTYDPFSYAPIVAVAGALGLIYIVDLEEKRVRRMFKGHGGVRSNHVLVVQSS